MCRRWAAALPMLFCFAQVIAPVHAWAAQTPAAAQPNLQQLQQQLAFYAERANQTGYLVTSVLLFAMAAGCLLLWWNSRSSVEFRSVGVYLLVVSAVMFVDYLGSADWNRFLTTLASWFFIEMSADTLRISKRRWIIPVRIFFAAFLIFNWHPGAENGHAFPVDLSELIVPVLLILRLRRPGRQDWLISWALAIVWFFRLQLDNNIRAFSHLPFFIEIAGWRWYYGPLVMVLFGATALTVFVHELIQDQREKQRLSAELEAGRAVQQVLLGTETPDIPGLRIESAYKPAGEVGGDFFQIIPTDTGGALVVIGDVSGKGLQAAMTVSAIMGALRMMPSIQPAHILRALNRSLSGRLSGGLVTCCVARIEPDGRMRVANAGHLAPYCNGEELELESGLPLGVIANVDYTEAAFILNPSDALIFMSDGVVEARNANGELFGFDRTMAISMEPAEKVSQAAQAFGQEDDITVLTLTFAPAGAACA